MLGRGSGAKDAGTPFDDIEIDLDDPPLAPGQLDQRREIGFEGLTEPSAVRPQKHVLRGLHQIVLAPSSPPSPLWYCSQAISIALQSKPKCRQKRWSSLAI